MLFRIARQPQASNDRPGFPRAGMIAKLLQMRLNIFSALYRRFRAFAICGTTMWATRPAVSLWATRPAVSIKTLVTIRGLNNTTLLCEHVL